MKPFKFYLITDTHYFAKELGCYGEEYKSFMQFEQKCFAETEAINKSVFSWLCEAQDADTVLIAGDLSFNGERKSHEGFIKLLKDLKAAGKRVYVITAGHDFNEKCFAFNDTGRIEFPGTKREDLFDLYYEFGFSDAISVHKESLSYVAQLSDGVRLLALNNDGDEEYKKTYTKSQMEWILSEIRKGREEGQMMFVMNHYPLIPACPIFGLIGDAVMPDADRIIGIFADEGVHLGFTGHMHNQSIKLRTTEKGNKFYDVCTGSVIGCPAFMRLVEIQDKKSVKIESIPVPDFEWDTEGLSTEEYFRRQFDMMINTYIECMAYDPERLMRKLRLPQKNILKRLLTVFGKFIDNATIGSVCKKVCVKCDDSIKDRSFKDFLVEIVRNVFVGNAPYTEETPEYKAFMGIIGRFSPILFIVKKKVKVKGRPLDIKAMLRDCLGNYSVDEYNTTLILEE